jgi:hypothetical protein
VPTSTRLHCTHTQSQGDHCHRTQRETPCHCLGGLSQSGFQAPPQCQSKAPFSVWTEIAVPTGKKSEHPRGMILGTRMAARFKRSKGVNSNSTPCVKSWGKRAPYIGRLCWVCWVVPRPWSGELGCGRHRHNPSARLPNPWVWELLVRRPSERGLSWCVTCQWKKKGECQQLTETGSHTTAPPPLPLPPFGYGNVVPCHGSPRE